MSPQGSGVSAWTWAYITPVGSPISLDVGDQIVLSFNYKYNINYGGAPNIFQFGLFNGGSASRQTIDNTGFTQTTLQGYTVQVNAQTGSATGAAFYVENNNGNAGSPFTTAGGGNYTKVGTDFPSIDAATSNKTAQLIVTRTSSGVDLTPAFDLNNPSSATTRSLLGATLFSFDAIACHHQNMSSTTWLDVDAADPSYSQYSYRRIWHPNERRTRR